MARPRTFALRTSLLVFALASAIPASAAAQSPSPEPAATGQSAPPEPAATGQSAPAEPASPPAAPGNRPSDAPAPAPPSRPAPTSDTPEPASAERPFAGVERPWLYSPDATAPPPGHVIASLGVGYAEVNRGAARPFAGNLAQAGAVFGANVEVGVLRFLSVTGEGLLAGDGSSVSAGGMLGVNAYPLPASLPVKLALSAGYLRELGGDDGVWGRVTVAGDIGPVRLTLMGLGSHIFAPDRDAFDLLVSAGASYRVIRVLSLGVEYVAQDIEDAWEEEEEDGGIRHFVSPMASLELGRVRLTAGPAFGLSEGSPRVLGRLQAGFSF